MVGWIQWGDTEASGPENVVGPLNMGVFAAGRR